MNLIGVIFLGVAGLLGVYLYLLKGSEHSEISKARDLDHKIQVERFDRDFDNAWNGQKLTDPERGQRLRRLEEQAKTQQTHTEHNTQAMSAREQELRRALDQLAGFKDKKEKGSP